MRLTGSQAWSARLCEAMGNPLSATSGRIRAFHDCNARTLSVDFPASSTSAGGESRASGYQGNSRWWPGTLILLPENELYEVPCRQLLRDDPAGSQCAVWRLR